jgi:hypothetical protein
MEKIIRYMKAIIPNTEILTTSQHQFMEGIRQSLSFFKEIMELH